MCKKCAYLGMTPESFSSYSDLVADISIDSSLPQPAAADASSPKKSSSQTYTVKPGDSLSKIAKQF
jgi:LysM repeat protein